MDTDLGATTGAPQVVVAESAEELYRRAAAEFARAFAEAEGPDSMFFVALSGGSTPRGLYQMLSRESETDRVPWDRTQVFFSDERFVPADSPESNQRMATETLLSRVPIPDRFVHRVPTSGVSPQEAASIYEEGIRRTLLAGAGEVPAFDLIMLGLGTDGHAASLFPGTEALDVTDRLVVANHVPQMDTWRITFTYPLVNAARRVMFVVEGDSKAQVVADVLSGGDYPAARVRPGNGQLIWLLDAAAASRLPPGMHTG